MQMIGYARLVQFPVKPGNRDWGDGLADQFKELMANQPGFRRVTFIREEQPEDGSDDIFGALSVWESRQAAEEAGKALQAALSERGADYLTGPPTVKFYEAYEP
jgi:heme-degrading monooxygenase HmoA